MAAVSAMAAEGCDAGKQHVQRTKGPLVTITDINVGVNKPLPADGEIQIAFDRYLLPKSVTRQSAGVLITKTGDPQPVTPVITRYDPITRTVFVTGSGPNGVWLTPGQPYKLRLTLPPDENADDRAFRAIDRQTLDPNQTLEFAFFAGEPSGQPNEKDVDFCGDVLPIFTAKCSRGECHGSRDLSNPAEEKRPAAGLVLDSYTGILKTALYKVANGANTGAPSSAEPVGRVFGVNMEIIKPEEPDNSWLLYKIELAPPPTFDSPTDVPFVCNKTPTLNEVAPRTADPFKFDVRTTPADEIERAILNDFVVGREMPYPPEHALTFDERERIRVWIGRGAKMTDCGGCSPAAFGIDSGVSR